VKRRPAGRSDIQRSHQRCFVRAVKTIGDRDGGVTRGGAYMFARADVTSVTSQTPGLAAAAFAGQRSAVRHLRPSHGHGVSPYAVDRPWLLLTVCAGSGRGCLAAGWSVAVHLLPVLRRKCLGLGGRRCVHGLYRRGVLCRGAWAVAGGQLSRGRGVWTARVAAGCPGLPAAYSWFKDTCVFLPDSKRGMVLRIT
jgi:hypothetical protein